MLKGRKGKEVEILQSQTYSNVNDACLAIGYVNSPYGAPCTKVLKKRVRHDWERKQDCNFRYVWGLDADEEDRADRIIKTMHESNHVFPLIDK